jgi:hypothetical protein
MRTDVTVERVGLLSALTELVEGHPFLVAAGVVVAVVVGVAVGVSVGVLVGVAVAVLVGVSVAV